MTNKEVLVPRYRFSWSNFEADLLTQMCAGLGFYSGDPVSDLRNKYGARPKPNFVQDAWQTLLTTWLDVDDLSRSLIVEDLRASGLGQVAGPVKSKKSQLQYLATCRNARTLREIVLDVFLVAGEPDQLSSSSNPDPEAAQASAVSIKPPTSPTEAHQRKLEAEQAAPEIGAGDLDTWVENVLAEFLGFKPRRDADGDIGIPRGSSVLYVRPHEADSPFLEIFSPILSNFEMSSGVYEALNSINAQVPLAKTTVNSDGTLIVMSAVLFVDSITARNLWEAVATVSGAADHFDDLLRKRFGGRTAIDVDDDGIEI